MKNNIIGIIILFFIALTAASCTKKIEKSEIVYQCPMKCEGEKTYFGSGKICPVCNMNLEELAEPSTEKHEHDSDEILETSIFNLTSKWQTQDDQEIELKDLKGDVLVMVMIYTSCKAACPRLIADMRDIHDDVNKKSTKYVLVSIDPEVDTPARLKAFAKENEMDNEQWIFLQGSIDDVREFSNVLAVKYKKISPLDFSHSNIISVFDQDGVLHYQQEGLGVDNKEIVGKIVALEEQGL